MTSAHDFVLTLWIPGPMASAGIGVIAVLGLLLLVSVAVVEVVRHWHGAAAANLRSAVDSEAQFRTLAEAIPQIVFTTTPDGMNDYCNRRWYELTGLTEDETLGMKWSQMIHPDDQDICLTDWQKTLATGQPLETEYRIRDKTGAFRWFLVRAIPMRNAEGVVIKWFGTGTDVEDQKHHLQVLENQIKERTLELADANTRLQEEMWERDNARKELDAQNEKMVASLRERSQRATLLSQMGELMQSCVSKDEVFSAALGFAPKIFPATRGAVALLNPGRSLAEVIGSWADCALPTPVFESTACWALRTGHTHLVLAGDTTAPCAHALGVKNTYLCIPIMAQGEALGILHFQTTDEAPTVASEELSFKTTFAGQIGLSIANIRLREALRTQSIRDPLTGLYNRRYLEETLEREIRRAGRADASLGLLMLDLDHFKIFNDTYGHEAGDTVLREVASFLVSSVRAEDVVCRFGGEEFVVILPTASLKVTQARAERLCGKVRELTVQHMGKSVGTITVSIGVAVFPQHGLSPKSLQAAADAALYRAKHAGRDRVMIASKDEADEESPSSLPANLKV